MYAASTEMSSGVSARHSEWPLTTRTCAVEPTDEVVVHSAPRRAESRRFRHENGSWHNRMHRFRRRNLIAQAVIDQVPDRRVDDLPIPELRRESLERATLAPVAAQNGNVRQRLATPGRGCAEDVHGRTRSQREGCREGAYVLPSPVSIVRARLVRAIAART